MSFIISLSHIHYLLIDAMYFSMLSFSLLLATSRALCFAKKSARPLKHATRLLSITGGSLPENDDVKPFYALGVNIAKQVGSELKGILSKEEMEVMLKGFGDSMLDAVTADEERQILTSQGQKLNEILGGRATKLLDDEKKKGESYAVKYLLSNPRAVKTPSGLIFNEIIAGVGAQPTKESTVNVHYHGTLVNGNVFDSSVQRGEPITFPLKNVIQGWQEGVSMMRAGGKATLVVPSELAYGDNGSPPVIPPGATLVFEVELISVA